ncbi:hypothetical protein ACI2K6_10430 [Microbacterium sp. NPDC006705]|uniref:hypothetical protein n=1 Tax=Microbacterium sp. NPDC006705 TaxID=3364181 RepID=UPI00384D7E06
MATPDGGADSTEQVAKRLGEIDDELRRQPVGRVRYSPAVSENRPGSSLVNWVIAMGAIASAVFIWWAIGRPGFGDVGQDIYDGDWSCEQPGGNGLGAMGGPGITVIDGDVTSASYFDMTNGEDIPVDFGNVNVVNPTTLTLTTLYPPFYDAASGTYKFTDVQGTFECTKD